LVPAFDDPDEEPVEGGEAEGVPVEGGGVGR